MARYKFTLAYDGTEFFGSQRQVGRRTVQGDIEHALRSIGWVERSILLAGRTDTGVHSVGQVAAADIDWQHSEEDLVRAINASLKKDISVQSAEIVGQEFHPRFDAVARSYLYKLYCQPFRNPLRERTTWRIWPEIDFQALQIAANLFIGEHDFSAFGSPITPGGSTIRKIDKASWELEADGCWRFDVKGNSFLYRMVRRMVFVQVAVARNKISTEDIYRALNNKVKDKRSTDVPSGTAPAHGLTLSKIEY